MIELISGIRSAKAELKITPKLFCNILFDEKSSKIKKLVENNLNLFKQVGRVNNVIQKIRNNKNSLEILVLKKKYPWNFLKMWI